MFNTRFCTIHRLDCVNSATRQAAFLTSPGCLTLTRPNARLDEPKRVFYPSVDTGLGLLQLLHKGALRRVLVQRLALVHHRDAPVRTWPEFRRAFQRPGHADRQRHQFLRRAATQGLLCDASWALAAALTTLRIKPEPAPKTIPKAKSCAECKRSSRRLRLKRAVTS